MSPPGNFPIITEKTSGVNLVSEIFNCVRKVRADPESGGHLLFARKTASKSLEVITYSTATVVGRVF